MKPSWKDAPEWANWLAMDDDESWWWFENEPIMYPGYWVTNEGKYGNAGRVLPWQHSKTKRPAKEEL